MPGMQSRDRFRPQLVLRRWIQPEIRQEMAHPITISVTVKHGWQPRRSFTRIRQEDGLEFFLTVIEDCSAVTVQEPLVVVRLRSDLVPSRPDQFECAHIVRACILGRSRLRFHLASPTIPQLLT